MRNLRHLYNPHAEVSDMREPETIFQIARLAAEKYQIPIVLHLDHGDSPQLCKEAIKAGFSSVMLDCTDEPIKLQIEKTKDVTAYAHENNASSEGEIALRGEWEEIWMTAPEDSSTVCKGNRL